MRRGQRDAREFADFRPGRLMAEFFAAIRQIEAQIAAETADAAIDARCVPVLLHHGQRTERSIVLFHGFTNCPRQFAQLASAYFERGYNVYVPRLPRHGMRDKLTPLLAGLTCGELVECAARTVAFGQDLAAKVSVLGLSVGGTLAAWAAQTQPIDCAVVIAPFFSVVRVPSLVEPFLAATLAGAPNLELWWDPRVKQDAPPDHGYPRFSTHALAQCLALGQTIRDLAQNARPLATRTILVLNAKDPAIDNGAARDVLHEWIARGAPAREYLFENLDTRHDIIEPLTYPAAATLVYPVLLELVMTA